MTIDLKRVAALPVVALGAPEEAEAAVNASCPGPYGYCYGYPGWTEFALLSGGAIPADGVLVLQGSWRGLEQPGPETIALTVTADGMPVAGAIEVSQFPGIVIWRPEAAWTPGAMVTITGAATNAKSSPECLEAELPVVGEVTIEAEPGAALAAVDIDAVEMFELVPTISLETLACCAGVTPTLLGGGCYSEPSVDFDPSQCTPIAATGILQLTLTGTPAATGPVEQQVVYVLRVEGVDEVSFAPMFGRTEQAAPVCAAIDAVDLGTGMAVKGAEECFGAAFVDQVGAQALDPAAALDCQPFTCEVDDYNYQQWDLDECTPFGGGDIPTGGNGESGGGSSGGTGSGGGTGGQDDDKGCGCAAADGRPGLWGLAGLVWLARRRRR